MTHTRYRNYSTAELLDLAHTPAMQVPDLWTEILQRLEQWADAEAQWEADRARLEEAADRAESAELDMNTKLANAEEALDRMTDQRNDARHTLAELRARACPDCRAKIDDGR